jgi:RNA polymerase sigma factor (sigma-70 family)
LEKDEKDSLFTTTIIPHLDAAYNLARWLARNGHDADDIMQDSFVRAYSYFNSFSGASGKAWLLAIVRNTFYTWHQKKLIRLSVEVNEEVMDEQLIYEHTPDEEMEKKDMQEEIRAALNSIPLEFREVIILREMESMSYKEIAAMIQIPIGTVMSRIARGREMLRVLLSKQLNGEV